MKGVLYWAPRILAIVFNIFLAIFALDVFSEPNWAMALIMHLIPNFILAILTIIAWKKEQAGGLLFLVSGLIAIWFFHSVILSTPVFIIGILFLMG